MTRKDYVKLAQVFKEVLPLAQERTVGSLTIWSELNAKIINVLKEDNARFDVNRWNNYIDAAEWEVK
jgi:hypothetical protein